MISSESRNLAAVFRTKNLKKKLKKKIIIAREWSGILEHNH